MSVLTNKEKKKRERSGSRTGLKVTKQPMSTEKLRKRGELLLMTNLKYYNKGELL